MKRFTPAFAALTMMAACAVPAMAQADAASMPSVREGDFFCFRDLPASQINFLPAADPAKAPARKVMRGPKLGNSKFDNTDGHDLREVPTEGDYHCLVILVDFQDVAFSQRRDDPRSLIDEMLNLKGFSYQGATGSANDFYQNTSGGKFNPIFDVYGPVSCSKKEREYVNNDGSDTYVDANTGQTYNVYKPGRMVEEVIGLVDDEIDFSKYDSNGDGLVDFVYFFFAGRGATTGGHKDNTIWPHAFTLTAAIGAPIKVDGVKVNRYATSSEIGSDGRLSGIGTFCHEFGHVLGLPDLYDTANNTGRPSECFTPGSFSSMDAGNYNNNEHTPATFSSYEQYSLEWMKPADITGGGSFTLLPIEARPFAYKVPSTFNPKEYFLLEGRASNKYDQYLEGHGLLVWHIDFDLSIWDANTANNNKNHQRIDIIEADNHESASTRSGDVFPGASGICEYFSNTSPAFKDWSGKAVGYELKRIMHNFDGTTSFEITAADGKVMENVELAAAAPVAVGASANSISLEWPEIKNATGYYVSLFNADNFHGQVLQYSDFEEGWNFRPVEVKAEDGLCALTIEGLKPNANYGIMVYAVSDLNASRMTAPIYASTVDGSDFENARTNLHLSKIEGDVFMEWDEIEGAEGYVVSVVTRRNGAELEPETCDFTGNALPNGWTGTGRIDNANNYFGQAAPSYRLVAAGSYLMSPVYETPISKLTFWCRKRYSDDAAELSVYTADKQGRWQLAKVLTEFNSTKTGETLTLDLPAGSYGVKLLYNFAVTDLNFSIDDLVITFAGEPTDTPVLAEISNESATSALIKGLEEGKDYVAFVTPTKADADGARSNEVAFRLENVPVSGVEDIIADAPAAAGFAIDGMTVIPADADATYSVFTADGIAVAANIKGAFTLPARGLYIISADGKAIKVMI